MAEKSLQMANQFSSMGNKTSFDDLTFIANRMLWSVGNSLYVMEFLFLTFIQ